ncbi:MAG: hypothetical protein V4538_01540 [Bacteroidota bacterium]
MFSILPTLLYAVGSIKSFFLSNNIKVIVYFIGFKALSELISYCFYIAKLNHSYFTGAYCALELLFIIVYFTLNKANKHLFKYYMLVFLIVVSVLCYELMSNSVFPRYGRTLQCIGVLGICINHGIKWLKQDGARTYELIIIIALTAYNSISWIAFFFAKDIPINYQADVFSTVKLANIFCNTALLGALYQYKTNY